MVEYIGWIDDEYNVVLDHNQEIVRCRDCKYFHELGYYHNAYTCWLTYADIEPDGFCAWGERRKDAQ